MDWQFITHHLTSGYTPVASALVLYFIILYVMGKRQTIDRIPLYIFLMRNKVFARTL